MKIIKKGDKVVLDFEGAYIFTNEKYGYDIVTLEVKAAKEVKKGTKVE